MMNPMLQTHPVRTVPARVPVSGRKFVNFAVNPGNLSQQSRFLSWAGRRMEGVNIDWVLEKLGFEHARLTIPKWVQRGAMDPMDRFLSVFTLQIARGSPRKGSQVILKFLLHFRVCERICDTRSSLWYVIRK